MSDLDSAVARMNALTETEHTPTDETVTEVAQEPQVTETEQPEGTEQDSQPDPEVVMHTVKVGGEEFQVPEDELRSGYMKNADYQRKTKDLHKRSEALKAKEAEIDAQLGEAEALLDMELTNLESPEMVALKEADPDAYLREFERVQGKVKKFTETKEKRLAERQDEMKELAGKEREALELAIPEWLDPELKSKEANAIMQRWSEQGYSTEEINTTIDHRRFVSERKAMLYDQLMSQDLSPKEVKTPPKSQQPGTAKAGEDRTDSKIKDMRGKLRKTGHMRDAAKLFRSMME